MFFRCHASRAEPAAHRLDARIAPHLGTVCRPARHKLMAVPIRELLGPCPGLWQKFCWGWRGRRVEWLERLNNGSRNGNQKSNKQADSSTPCARTWHLQTHCPAQRSQPSGPCFRFWAVHVSATLRQDSCRREGRRVACCQLPGGLCWTVGRLLRHATETDRSNVLSVDWISNAVPATAFKVTQRRVSKVSFMVPHSASPLRPGLTSAPATSFDSSEIQVATTPRRARLVSAMHANRFVL